MVIQRKGKSFFLLIIFFLTIHSFRCTGRQDELIQNEAPDPDKNYLPYPGMSDRELDELNIIDELDNRSDI
ncbi:MAG: hypothetical protein ABFR36_04065 [Acidobacteriota bacterium]